MGKGSGEERREKGGEHQLKEEEGRGDMIWARFLRGEMKASALAAADVFDQRGHLHSRQYSAGA
jgi:hypothetical protein